jgi:hypothetical protein
VGGQRRPIGRAERPHCGDSRCAPGVKLRAVRWRACIGCASAVSAALRRPAAAQDLGQYRFR